MTMKSHKIKITLLIMLLIIRGTGGIAVPDAKAQDAFADDPFLEEEQFFEEEFEDDLNLDELDLESGLDGEGNADSFDSEFGGEEETFPTETTDEDQYVDEDLIPDDTQQLLESALLQRRDFLAEERANFVPNILYGVGTGLMIGGWFALLTAGTSRDTLRSIGLGIVLGGFMGSVVGSRSVLETNPPRPIEQAPPPEEPIPQGRFIPEEERDETRITLALEWKF